MVVLLDFLGRVCRKRVAQGKGAVSMRVACVMMQRNEVTGLEPWLRYHGYMFGYENLFVIDHLSDEPPVAAVLARYRRLGVRVWRLPEHADFRDKGRFVSTLLGAVDALGVYDILLPLDCDEFVAMRDEAGAPCCARRTLRGYLDELKKETAILEVKENFLNTLGHPSVFFALPYQKVFFTGGGCGTVDDGSHTAMSPRSDQTVATRLVYVHFHHRRYQRLVRMSREKLRPYVDVDDPEALAAYQGTGWHLVQNLLRGEAAYLSIMVPGNLSIEFPAFTRLLEVIGINPRFCEE